MTVSPLLILAIAVFTILTLIIVLRFNTFIALIVATFVVSILAPGEFTEKITRVTLVFGGTVGKIGIIIAMAAVIGRCLFQSGAADRITNMLLSVFGKKHCDASLMSSGFVLSIPVFFDTVFYLLLPLARSIHRKTNKSYLVLIMAMAAGTAITHALVPPTPGPLILANTLGVSLGLMIAIGLLVGTCTAITMFFFIRWYGNFFDIPMRTWEGENETIQANRQELPGLFISILPIVLPVVMISSYTIVPTLVQNCSPDSMGKKIEQFTSIFGNPNFVMPISAAIAMFVYWQQRKPTRERMTATLKQSLMNAGMIILITSAGGAFGAMLKEAQVGPMIEKMITSHSAQSTDGIKLLLLGFSIAAFMKFSQGSSTVSMITTSAMFAGLIESTVEIGFNRVYLACAIGFGALCGTWMNDSGFWIISKMSGLTVNETLKTWAVALCTLSIVGLCFTLLFATILPLV